ncbi:MAG: flippase [candidate division Zixibacteria bacterium]|nr:flippase [candidate division Zixibacteria bacterium]
MSHTKAFVILRNSGSLGLSRFAGRFFYFLLFIIIGRYLGPLDLGKFSFALSFTAIFFLVNDLGISILAVRDVSQDKSKAGKYLGNIILLKLLLATFTFLASFLALIFMGYPEETTTIVILLGLASLLNHFSLSLRWVFQAYQKLEYESVTNLIQYLGYFILGFSSLILNLGIIGIGYSQIITGILITLLSWFIVSKRFHKIKIEIDLSFWKGLLRKSFSLSLLLVFTSLFLNADTVLLSFFKGEQTAGIYNAANRLAIAGRMVPATLIAALFPIMSELARASQEDLKRILEKSLALTVCLGLPLCLAVTFLSEKIILFFYGQEFISSASVLQIVIWGLFCMGLSVILGYALISLEKQKIYTLITGLGLGVNLVLNLSLIPKLAQIGSSLAITMTELVILVAAFYSIAKLLDFKLKVLIPSVVKISVASLVMLVVLYLTRDFHLLLIIGLGALSYLAVLFSFNGIYGYNLCRVKELIFARM